MARLPNPERSGQVQQDRVTVEDGHIVIDDGGNLSVRVEGREGRCVLHPLRASTGMRSAGSRHHQQDARRRGVRLSAARFVMLLPRARVARYPLIHQPLDCVET